MFGHWNDRIARGISAFGAVVPTQGSRWSMATVCGARELAGQTVGWCMCRARALWVILAALSRTARSITRCGDGPLSGAEYARAGSLVCGCQKGLFLFGAAQKVPGISG